jgi:hypothetical protein
LYLFFFQFVERLNDFNMYQLYFPEENPKHLAQDKFIEILDQRETPKGHAAIVAANIDIFDMFYEEIGKIRLINVPSHTPHLDSEKSVTKSRSHRQIH